MTADEQAPLGLSHVAIVVPDVEAAAERFRQLFAVSASAAVENLEQGVRMRRIALGPVFIELLEPIRPDGPLARFLSRHPAGGLHHLSLKTADLDSTLAGVTEAGAGIVGTPGLNVDGSRIAFLKPATVLGVLIELEEDRGALEGRKRAASGQTARTHP